MSKVFTATLCCIIFGMTSLRGQDCKKLENGNYRLKAKTKGYVDFALKITDDDFVSHSIPKRKERKWVTDKDKNGKIEWKSECVFVMIYEEKSTDVKRDTARFTRPKGWGELCIELSGSNKYRVTWTENLQITNCKGKIVRIED